MQLYESAALLHNVYKMYAKRYVFKLEDSIKSFHCLS